MFNIEITDDDSHSIITYQSNIVPRISEELNFTCEDGKTVQGTVNDIIHMVKDTDTGKVCNKILVSVVNIKIIGGKTMKEVYKNLFVGNQSDYETVKDNEDFSFVLAAKEPWHRQAIGYTGRACDKNNDEYLMSYKENKLILNLVDAPKPEFFDKRIIAASLNYFDLQIEFGQKVLICCNKGESRSPSIALLYLIKQGIIKGETFEDCEAEFMKVYPEYNPGEGIRGFCKLNWQSYARYFLEEDAFNKTWPTAEKCEVTEQELKETIKHL